MIPDSLRNLSETEMKIHLLEVKIKNNDTMVESLEEESERYYQEILELKEEVNI